MAEPHDPELLDEVMETHEVTHPDRREHAKADLHPDEEELQDRVKLERQEVGLHEEEDNGLDEDELEQP